MLTFWNDMRISWSSESVEHAALVVKIGVDTAGILKSRPAQGPRWWYRLLSARGLPRGWAGRLTTNLILRFCARNPNADESSLDFSALRISDCSNFMIWNALSVSSRSKLWTIHDTIMRGVIHARKHKLDSRWFKGVYVGVSSVSGMFSSWHG